MPVVQSGSCGAAFDWGRAAVAGHQYKYVYVMPPEWEAPAYDFWEDFTERAARSVIDDELSKVPVASMEQKYRWLLNLKDRWFAAERKNYFQTKGARTSGLSLIQAAPPEFISSIPPAPKAASEHSVVSNCADAGLTDWDGDDVDMISDFDEDDN